ncbi:PREDICTED: alpha-tocopherol transfer protein-like [Nicrophorus vespilloides]|uniref:Alpha-tocopherol transfer protein-like n=1 Tax=Nicrophorus vespilloides TaxID=110193 RepID=A0ABM1MK45_NICVS|nr:PREDICTED: alpha-tocopherol transfer protein-like [Nicrophorus vespilloides]XP_017774945.1 PREDICTED: alpha-tocopherol transfer protein-like [Nicrophorus vespilloides]
MTSTKLMMSNGWIQAAEEMKIRDENLLDAVAKTATRELREDESTRRQCLRAFRDWVKAHQDIENCLTDDSFLLRFLRAKKFSIPMAQQTLLKYLNLRKKFKHIFYDLDCQDTKVNELMDKGYIFASPYRDNFGRRVILTIASKLDPNRFTSTDMARAHIITYETLLDEEENQILGFTYFGDGAKVGVGHVSMWSVTEFATLMKWGEQSCPIRHKALHIINLQSTFKYVIEFAANRVSEKLRDRFKLHSSVNEMLQFLPAEVLPKEYGGIMPMAEMIALWKKELASKRERLLSFDAMNLLSDRCIMRRRNRSTDIETLQGSFRKLEVD